MKPERLIQTLPISVLITVILGTGLYVYNDTQAALGLLLGGLWSTANLWVLHHLFREIFIQKRRLYIVIMAQIKVPLLYGTGYLALTNLPANVVWLVVGFHIPIVCILFESFRSLKKR